MIVEELVAFFEMRLIIYRIIIGVIGLAGLFIFYIILKYVLFNEGVEDK